MNLFKIGLCLTLMISPAAFAADIVNPQITDAVEQTSASPSIGARAPSGRPWRTDNYVLLDDFQNHDANASAEVGATEDLASNIKSPGVYINEENAFPNEETAHSVSPSQSTEDDVNLNYINESNDADNSGVVIFHKDEDTTTQDD